MQGRANIDSAGVTNKRIFRLNAEHGDVHQMIQDLEDLYDMKEDKRYEQRSPSQQALSGRIQEKAAILLSELKIWVNSGPDAPRVKMSKKLTALKARCKQWGIGGKEIEEAELLVLKARWPPLPLKPQHPEWLAEDSPEPSRPQSSKSSKWDPTNVTEDSPNSYTLQSPGMPPEDCDMEGVE